MTGTFLAPALHQVVVAEFRDPDQALEAIPSLCRLQVNGVQVERWSLALEQACEQAQISMMVAPRSREGTLWGLPDLMHARFPKPVRSPARGGLLAEGLVLTVPGVPRLDGLALTRDHENETHYHQLIALRRNLDGTTRGLTGDGLRLCRVDKDLLSFLRFDAGGPGDETVVVANLTGRQIQCRLGFPGPGPWVLRYASDRESGEVLYTDAQPLDGHPCSAELTLAPGSLQILSENPWKELQT